MNRENVFTKTSGSCKCDQEVISVQARTMTYLAASSEDLRRCSMTRSLQAEITEIFNRNSDELRWLAEVILGHKQGVEICIVRAGQLAESEGVVASDWLEPWIKRCLARAAIERIRIDAQSVARNYARYAKLAMTRPILNSAERQMIRLIRPERIVGACNVLERAALILHAYLGLSAQDCALLLDCHRAVIEPAYANALREIFKTGLIPQLALEKMQGGRPEGTK